MNDKFEKLAEPFPPTDIEWRAGATNSDKTKALALAYITSRAVMDRLDNVVGPENWRDEYRPGPNGGVVCGLSIRVGDEWITKWDGADNSDIEGVKGGLSDAFKRAGYKWGIGRYLYNLEGTWIECEVFGKTVRLKGTPKLPAWALPKGTQPAPPKVTATQPATTSTNGTNGNGHKPAPTVEIPANASPAIRALMECGAAESVASAAGMLNKLKLGGKGIDVIRATGKTYRAWRDSGLESDAAAEKTLAGEIPA